MKIELNNIEVEDNEVILHLDKVYVTTLEELGFDKYCEEMVEECTYMWGGYAEYYNESNVYESTEHFREQHTDEEIIQMILEDYTIQELEDISLVVTCCGDIVQVDTDRCPTCKENL